MNFFPKVPPLSRTPRYFGQKAFFKAFKAAKMPDLLEPNRQNESLKIYLSRF